MLWSFLWRGLVLMSLSDEEIQRLVDERANERRLQNFSRADEIKASLETFGVHLSDIPYRLGGGSNWIRNLDPLDEISLIDLSKEVYRINDSTSPRVQEIIQQSKEYLREIEKRRELTLQWKLTETNLLGRKYADIAFKFAMGGVCDVELFRLLSAGHMAEIKRFGHRKSCGVMDLVQMAEKLACAGIIDQEIYQTTSFLIRTKIAEAESAGQKIKCSSIETLESGEYSVLSSHPLRMLWRFAAKQSKHGKQRKNCEIEVAEKDGGGNETDSDEECDEQDGLPHSSASLPELASLFDDSSRPLVLDLGCGFGTSLLGLCVSLDDEFSSNQSEETPHKRPRLTPSSLLESDPQVAAYLDFQSQVRTKGCNFLGCDMSRRAIGYGNSLSARWSLQNRCQFLHCSVEDVLDLISSSEYPGPVIWININFPTPYSQRLLQYVAGMQSFVQSKKKMTTPDGTVSPLVTDSLPSLPTTIGNSQLPESLNEFMVSPHLFKKCALVFERQTNRPFLGFIYLQSNAEDVALTMRTFVDSLHLKESDASASIPFPELSITSSEDKLTGRYRCVDSAESSVSPAMISALWSSDVDASNSTWATPETAITNGSKRQELWSELFPVTNESKALFRAVGNGWWGHSPLPKKAQTETEAVCDYQQKPIHRIVFSYADS
jgi:SAM-dependent methyltransferase